MRLCKGLDKKSFKNVLFQIIERNNLTYRDLEKKIGISKSVLSRVKHEKDITADHFLILLSWMSSEEDESIQLDFRKF